MTIQNQLSRRLLFLVGTVLGLVLGLVYGLAEQQRSLSFKEKLCEEAYSAGHRYVDQTINLSSGTTVGPAGIWIYNYQNKLLYEDFQGEKPEPLTQNELAEVRRLRTAVFRRGTCEMAGVAFDADQYNSLLVVRAESDSRGRQQLAFLRWVLVAAWIFGMGTTWALSYGFSGRALKPLRHLMDRVDAVAPEQSLQFVLEEADRPDEIGRLARQFNEWMRRLEGVVQNRRYFLALASHQLRTPLASTKARIEVLLRKSDLNAGECKDALQEVLQSLHELNRTSQHLLTLVQLEAGPRPLHLQAFALDELLGELQASWKRTRPDATLSLVLDEAVENAEAFRLQGDTELLRTAVDNLIENALKYSDAPNVKLGLTRSTGTAEAPRPRLLVTVTDQGRGISQDQIPHLFEPFYRGNNSSGSQGHGLGLALVRQIVEWHGGSISVTSELGKGSTFRMELPPIFENV
jgi:signal transduction histidine kinase